GHAIEARVYAEDAYAGFLPQAGTATLVQWPERVEGIRLDHALESGQVVSTAYDPMLGKVIAYGDDREEARARLVEALDHTVILGLTTNTGYLRALADTPEFTAGALDTAWLDHHQLPAPDDADARVLAAVVISAEAGERPGPWRGDGFRSSGGVAPVIRHGHTFPVRRGWFSAWRNRDLVEMTLDDGTTGSVRLSRSAVEVVVRGQRFVFAARDTAWTGTSAGDGTVTSPMPGTVLDVRIALGAEVAEGDVLGVVEAMKMELALTAPFAGTVTAVDAVAGAQVALGAPLFVVEPVVEPAGGTA
ncbi:biotin/lipoyl-containing protein, partial [Nocardioides fonticola]